MGFYIGILSLNRASISVIRAEFGEKSSKTNYFAHERLKISALLRIFAPNVPNVLLNIVVFKWKALATSLGKSMLDSMNLSTDFVIISD